MGACVRVESIKRSISHPVYPLGYTGFFELEANVSVQQFTLKWIMAKCRRSVSQQWHVYKLSGCKAKSESTTYVELISVYLYQPNTISTMDTGRWV